MAYDEELALRLRMVLNDVPELYEKKMFGGLGFILHGNMACGVSSSGDLIVRVGRENYAAALARPHTRPFELPGRRMGGWVVVEPEAVAGQAELRAWLQQGIDFARTLPAK